jgi:Flp pilus assembly protein TadG
MKSERGQLVVELVLLTPLLLLLVFLTFEFGRVFGYWVVVTNATREGARVGMMQTWCAPQTSCPTSDTVIIDRVAATAQYVTIQTSTPCTVSGNTSSAPATGATLPSGQTSCVAVVRWIDTNGDHVVQVWTVYQVLTLTPITGVIPFFGGVGYPVHVNVAGLSSMRSFQ